MKREDWDAEILADGLECLAKAQNIDVVELINRRPDLYELYKRKAQVPIGPRVDQVKER